LFNAIDPRSLDSIRVARPVSVFKRSERAECADSVDDAIR